MTSVAVEIGGGQQPSDAVQDLSHFLADPLHRQFVVGCGAAMVFLDGPAWARNLLVLGVAGLTLRRSCAVVLGW